MSDTAGHSAAIADFLEMMAAERGAAANTLAAYARDLDQVEAVIGDLLEAERDDLRQLPGHWAKLAPSTVARKVSALRQFYGFAVDERLRADDPSSALPTPRLRRPLPRILSQAQVEALLERAETEAEGDTPAKLRMLALLEMLYGSGLRATMGAAESGLKTVVATEAYLPSPRLYVDWAPCVAGRRRPVFQR